MDTDEPCGNICEGITNFCSSHNRQLRRESTNSNKQLEKKALLLERQKEKQKIARVVPNKVSGKREALNLEYARLNSDFKRDHPTCEARVNQYCTFYSTEVHHKKGRNEYFLDTTTWLSVCRTCHIFITDHPKEAIERGWSESRLAKHEPHKDMKLIKKELKPNEYQCSECGEVYENGWTEEEAREEALKNFGKDDVSNMAVVCDDCYNEIIKQ